jgi:hypothetical protein
LNAHSTSALTGDELIAGTQHKPSTPRISEPEPVRPRQVRLMDKLSNALELELAKLKRRAMGATMGVLRGEIAKSVHGEIGEELLRIIDEATDRLGLSGEENNISREQRN